MKLYSILFEDHRKGNVHADFIIKSRDEKGLVQQVNAAAIKRVLRKLGIPEEEIPEYSKLVTDQMDTGIDESLSQIFAVLGGVKPMWYDETNVINRMPAELWNKISTNLNRLGLKYENVDELSVLGKPKNVQTAVKQLNRIGGDIQKADTEFHRKMGLALGYPKDDVEKFVASIVSKQKP
jgi:hypothetical protein